jgi:hypothetical protein
MNDKFLNYFIIRILPNHKNILKSNKIVSSEQN